jgi:hypothetical protein
MKAKVVIENGETTRVLTPENDFEKGVIEKVYARKQDSNLCTHVDADYVYGGYSKHRIEISIREVN